MRDGRINEGANFISFSQEFLAPVEIIFVVSVIILKYRLPKMKSVVRINSRFNSSQSRSKYTLVLVRHGESTWNKENKFTGW